MTVSRLAAYVTGSPGRTCIGRPETRFSPDSAVITKHSAGDVNGAPVVVKGGGVDATTTIKHIVEI